MHAQMDAMHGQQVRAALAMEQGAHAMQQLHAAAGDLDHKLSESVANGVRFLRKSALETPQWTSPKRVAGCRKA